MTGSEKGFNPFTMVQLDDACYERCDRSSDCDLGKVSEIVNQVAELGNIYGSYFKVTCNGPEFTRFCKQLMCQRVVEVVVTRPEFES